VYSAGGEELKVSTADASSVRCGKLINNLELMGDIGFTALEASEQIYSVATELRY
jgi:hypothetical protein